MPDMSLRPGEAFAGYTIERELGSGGMGAVYLARHPRLPRSDALKLLRPELCSDPNFVGRFEREADTVAQLDHPNIVSVYDRGSADGQLWISMRFIDGTNAEKALAQYPAGMPPERAVRIVARVASALDYAHRHQLLHRDVKPANILLAAGPDDEDESERVFLSDFGVAKAIGAAADRIASLTSTGSVVATLDYASPEQITGQPLDHRSDIYALGCVLYKLLTGSVPYPGDSIATRVYGHLNSLPRPPSSLVEGLPTGFDEVVATAMAKEPDDRYPTCRALAQAARAALAASGRPEQAAPGSSDGDLATTVYDRASAEHPIEQLSSLSRASWVGSTGEGVVGSVPASDDTGATSLIGQPRQAGTPAQAGTASPAGSPAPTLPNGNHTDPGAAHRAGPGPRDPSQVGDPPVGRGTTPDAPARSGPTSGRDSGPASEKNSVRRRTLLIGGLVVVLLVGAGAWVVRSLGGVAGTASPATTSSQAASSATASSAASSSASSTQSSPGPVPGLPHSTPLPEEVLLSSRTVDGATNLYQVDAANGSVGAQVTTTSLGAAYPILSPDRGTVIFAQTGGPGGPTLLTAAVDGSGVRDLLPQLPADCATFFRPAWNPTEPTQIALPCLSPAGTPQVHLVSVVQGTEQGVIAIGSPYFDDLAFAPDGQAVTYWAADSAQSPGAIYVQPLTGNAAATRLTDPPAGASDADPTVSPDGTKIAFRRAVTAPGGQVTAHIVVVGVDGSDSTQLTDGQSTDQDPIWSPDGTQIAFKSDRTNAAGTTDNQIWVVDVDGTGLRELGAGSPGHADGAPAWGLR